jgi:hypothetical protein
VLAGTTPVLVHNCGGDVALGINEHSEALASNLRASGLDNVRTFNHPDLAKVDPESGLAGWQSGVNGALKDPNTNIHVALDGLDGANPAERFMNSYNAAKGGGGGATDWEMGQIGFYSRLGYRDWNSINFYHGGERVTIPEPSW